MLKPSPGQPLTGGGSRHFFGDCPMFGRYGDEKFLQAERRRGVWRAVASAVIALVAIVLLLL